MMMTALAWFFVSMLLFSIGAFVALFTVTTHKSLHGWVTFGFLIGAFISLLFILTTTLKT